MALFSTHGDVVREITRNYTLEAFGERVEFEPDEYWRLFSEAFDEISSGYDITAIAIDTQCETLIVADENGQPLRKAIVWLDNRAADEARQIADYFGEQTVYEVTGQPEVTATWPACKLLWIRKNEPDVFCCIRKIFLLADWLLFKLTGNYVTDKTLQSSSLYLDIRKGVWWQDMLEYIGIKPDLLPRIADTAETVGFYRNSRVVMGVMDQVAGAIGAGVSGPGYISEMTGTAMVVFSPADNIPPYNPALKVPCHINFNGKYCLLSWIPAAGISLKWFCEKFCDGLDYRKMDSLAADVAPGCSGLIFLPYQCGSFIPKYNPDARGVFAGLTLEHNRAHFYRAIMEAVAFSLKSMLDYLKIDCNEIRSIGGGANSSLWCQIKADVTRRRLVTLKHKETACLGSAIIAGVGAGLFPDVETACNHLIRTNDSYEFSGTDYTEYYQKYCELEAKYL